MTIDLIKLSDLLNKHIKGSGEGIRIGYDSEMWLEFSMGDVKYFADYEKILATLEKNRIDLHDQVKVYDVICKHVLNQLFASQGDKMFKEIISLESDLIK